MVFMPGHEPLHEALATYNCSGIDGAVTRGMALAIWVPVGLVFRAAARAAPLAVASEGGVPRGDPEREHVMESVRQVILTAPPQAGAGRVSPGGD